jgi:toxin FitB
LILLDTNVVSEPLKLAGAPTVLDWLDRQPAETLFLSTVSLAELLFGVAALPPGKRKFGLGAALESLISRLFAGRLLPFDVAAAEAYSDLRAIAKTTGRAIGITDAYIAAIAAARGFAVATRDVRPFEAAGLRVINPWTASP